MLWCEVVPYFNKKKSLFMVKLSGGKNDFIKET